MFFLSTDQNIYDNMQTGKKALWKHNLFGLTPDIGSAHHLLVCKCSVEVLFCLSLCLHACIEIEKVLVSWLQLHAKQHNDVKLMVEVMKLVKKNDLPLQPGMADIVFRYMSINKSFQFSLSPITTNFNDFMHLIFHYLFFFLCSLSSIPMLSFEMKFMSIHRCLR